RLEGIRVAQSVITNIAAQHVHWIDAGGAKRRDCNWREDLQIAVCSIAADLGERETAIIFRLCRQQRQSTPMNCLSVFRGGRSNDARYQVVTTPDRRFSASASLGISWLLL